MPTGVRVCRCAQASSYSSRLLPDFGQQKTFMSHSLAAVACFTAGGAHCSGTQRRRTLAGRVPISRKWMTCNGCALKMNPREFSSAGIPSSVARATMNGVSVDEASNSCLKPHRRSHRSEEHTSELQSQSNLVCRLLLEKNTYATCPD